MTPKSRVVRSIPFVNFKTPGKEALKNSGVDTDLLEEMFWNLRVMLKDAYISHEGHAIRLSYLLDNKSMSNRKKLKAESYYIAPEVALKLSRASRKVKIEKSELIEKLNALDIKSEKAVGGALVCKAPLVAAIQAFNQQLIDTKSPHYSTEAQRTRIISEWVKWFFRERYGIESDYKPERIRKLISPVEKKKVI